MVLTPRIFNDYIGIKISLRDPENCRKYVARENLGSALAEQDIIDWQQKKGLRTVTELRAGQRFMARNWTLWWGSPGP